MAKKKTARKTARRASGGKKTAGGSSSSAKKKSTKKAVPPRSAGRTVKKTPQKATGTKKTSKTSKTSKKTSKTAEPAKTTMRAPSKKSPARKTEARKPESRKAESRKSQAAAPPKPVEASRPAAEAPGDKGRKGITVVEKKRRTRQKAPPVEFPSGGRLLAPGGPLRKPLIPSGPQNVVDQPLAAEEAAGARKSPFNKRQLEKFRSMLLDKRRELLGDITGLESEALKSADGTDPRLGEHLEDQSSDAIDQAVSLDLAAADRRLLRMIDEALDRIEKGTYGLCVVTGKAIREERLRELPWASLSIEAARAEERRQMGRL